jgi:death-on-curing protein
MHGIVQNHPFADGNKRTALMLTELLIRRSGYSLEPRFGERIDDTVVAVANGDMMFDELAIWFKDRVVKR